MINSVSVDRLNELLGLHLDANSFQDWIESPGNLEPLCMMHHIGNIGVHSMPEPLWNVTRVQLSNLPPIAERLHHDESSDQPTDH